MEGGSSYRSVCVWDCCTFHPHFTHGYIDLLTAQYFIAPVKTIRNGDVDIDMLEAGAHRAGYAAQIKAWLGAIMYGQEEHEWGYVIENEESSA